MNSFLEGNGFELPKTYENLTSFEKALSAGDISLPVILKPIYGSGSESTYRLSNIDEIRSLFHKGMIIQQFIDGQEYGVDTFNNLEGKPIRCVVKRKISMRSGETDKAESIKNDKIRNLMISLAEKLGHICNLDSDVIVKDGHMYVIDLNPRFGGGYPATHEAGVNLLQLVVDMAVGKVIQPEFNNYKFGLYIMKEISITTTERLIV